MNFAFEKFFVVQKNFQKKIQRSSFEAKTFHEKEMSEAGSNYICLVVMLIDSVLKKDENYYSQVFFKNVTTLQKKKKNMWLDIFMMTYNSLLMLMIKKILMKKIKKEIF